MTPRESIEEYEALVTLRRQWEPTWDRIARLVLPRKSGLQFSNRTPGQRVENQYTSTAIRANELLAASIQGSLTSSVVRWFALANGNPTLRGSKMVSKWYEEFSDRLWANLIRSNFHQEIQEVYLDLGAFGNGNIFMLEKKVPGRGFGGFQFQAQEIGTYVIGEDADGHVDTVYRILKMSAKAAVRRWKGKVGPRIMALANQPDGATQTVDILHGVYPREGAGSYGTATPASKLPVASCYIDMESQHEIEKSGFHEMPAFAPRWTKVSGETYGRGPGFTSLGDISTFDEAVKLNLQAWAIAIRPPLMRRNDGVVGTPKVVPGAYIEVYDMDSLKPLESGQQVQVNQIEREALQMDIRNAFFWEQLQLPSTGQMYTATEVQRRLELMQRVLGPTLGRLDVELHQRVIMRGAGMMLRAGVASNWQDPNGAPEPPEEILEALKAGIAEVDIEYLGPLARAQKITDVDALQTAIGVVAPIVQIAPDAAVVLNAENIVRFVFEKRGLPVDLTRSKDEVKKINDAMAEQRAQEQQQQQLLNMSQVAKNAGPMMQGGAMDQLPPEMAEGAAAQGAGMAGGA